MDSLHFLRPYWLLACLPLLLLLWALWHRRLSSLAWRSVCDPDLLPYLLTGGDTASRRWPILAVGLAGLLGILALAGPVWEQREQPVFREQSALVIALDLSQSMEAEDIKPNRLTRARHELTDILRLRREGQTALLVYAAQPFVITPLTEDQGTILSQVNSLETGLMPAQGSRPDLAVTKAVELLEQAGQVQGDILLLTDGIGSVPPKSLLDALKNSHHRLSILAIGTQQGAPIPLAQGGFLKGPTGEIVIPRLKLQQLKTLAEQGGGRFSPLTLDDRDIQFLLAPLGSRMIDRNDGDMGFTADQWREEGPWLLLLLLPLAALAFRRGYLAVIVILLLPPPPAQAMEWQDLWLRRDQRAAQAMEQGRHQQAAELFSNPQWQAAAHYRAGDYDKAIEKLEGIKTADALYNKGNALAKSQRLEEALQAYNRSLELDPDNGDARHNKELVEKQLTQQQQKQQQQGENQKNPDNQEDAGKQQQSEDKSQQQQQGDSESQNQQQAADADAKNDSPADQDDQADPKDAEEMKQAQETAEPPSEPSEDKTSATNLSEDRQASDPATEQWLRRIPDDPGGLLRRKFQYQYRNMDKPKREQQPW